MQNSLKIDSASWCIDWATLTGPKKCFLDVQMLVRELPIIVGLKDCKGKNGYEQCVELVTEAGPAGILQAEGAHFNGWWCLRLYGLGCQLLGADRLRQLLSRILSLPGDIDPETQKPSLVHCTRVDISCDLRGPGCKTFIDNAIAAYDADCMMHARTAEARREYSAPGVLKRHEIRCGSDSSVQYVKIYDKGLESKEYGPGVWIRWEARFFKEMGDAALSQVLASGSAFSFASRAASVVEFCTDKRKHTFCPFYAEFVRGAVDGDVKRLASPKIPKTYLKWVSWLVHAVCPRLFRIASFCNTTPGAVLDILCGYFLQLQVPQQDERVLAESMDPIDGMACKVVREYLEGQRE